MRLRCVEGWDTDDDLVLASLLCHGKLIPWEVVVTKLDRQVDDASAMATATVVVDEVVCSPDGLLPIATAGIPALRMLQGTKVRDILKIRWKFDRARVDRKFPMFLVGQRLVAVEEVR